MMPTSPEAHSKSRRFRPSALFLLTLGLILPAAAPVSAGPPSGHHVEREDRGSGRDHYQRAYDRHRDGDWQESFDNFRMAYEMGYREEGAAYNAACAAARLDNRDAALEWLQLAIEEGFDITGYIETDADLVNLRGDSRFEAIRAAHRKTLAARRARGDWKARDIHADSLALFDELQREPTKAGDAYYDLGMKLHKMGEYDKAITAWEEAVELRHSPGASTYNIACALSRKGEINAALDHLDLAVERGYGDPDYFDEDDDLDNIRNNGRFATIRTKAELLELPSTGWGKGKSWFARPAWREAVTRYRDYVGSNPQSGRGWFNLGFASLKVEDPKTGVESFQRAYELGYSPATSAYNVACSYALSGDKDRAFDWLEKAIGDGFDNLGYLADDEDLDSLRDDPRFPDLKEWRRNHHGDHGWKGFKKHMKQLFQ